MELKEILGEDLYNQVAEQLKGKGPQGKDIEIVATNTGEYVPATKYEALSFHFSLSLFKMYSSKSAPI